MKVLNALKNPPVSSGAALPAAAQRSRSKLLTSSAITEAISTASEIDQNRIGCRGRGNEEERRQTSRRETRNGRVGHGGAPYKWHKRTNAFDPPATANAFPSIARPTHRADGATDCFVSIAITRAWAFQAPPRFADCVTAAVTEWHGRPLVKIRQRAGGSKTKGSSLSGALRPDPDDLRSNRYGCRLAANDVQHFVAAFFHDLRGEPLEIQP